MSTVAFVIEQPQDPQEYLPATAPNWSELPSFWDTELWKGYSAEAGLTEVSFEQGAYGHKTTKPTTLGTNLMSLAVLRGGKTNGVLEPYDQSCLVPASNSNVKLKMMSNIYIYIYIYISICIYTHMLWIKHRVDL